jgi:carbamoyl-phosphate synthase small subunit
MEQIQQALQSPPDSSVALLVLEDGESFVGHSFGASGRALGEIVFSTGMTGYQETITDPSYAGQIVVQAFPHIGNTGVNDEDPESSKVWVNGYIVRDPSPISSNWRATGDLESLLLREGIVGLSGIDTRQLVRHLRSVGVMRAGIFSGSSLAQTTDLHGLIEEVRQIPSMEGLSEVDEVTTKETYIVEPAGVFAGQAPVATVCAFDLGIKAMTPRLLSERGCRIYVMPASTGFEEVRQIAPDGVFFSNGPGDPATAIAQIEVLRKILESRIPFFGICFGNQLLGRALGFGTYKLKFGHRGVNQPVQDVRTGRVAISAHNHGFAVDVPVGQDVLAPYDPDGFGRVRVSHVNLNDNVVEGIECLDIPAFAVQYHPEAAGGPHDARCLFDDFMQLMQAAHKKG